MERNHKALKALAMVNQGILVPKSLRQDKLQYPVNTWPLVAFLSSYYVQGITEAAWNTLVWNCF